MESPLRILVVGCGAITQMFHLPVLGGMEDFRLDALVDFQLTEAKKLARQYKIPSAYKSIEEIPDGAFDAAVIATPPASHACLTEQLLNRGLHVFVEKPMAINAVQAQSMIATAEKAGKILSAGYFRRLFPSVRLLAKLLTDSSRWGEVIEFDAQEGSFFDWPSVTLGSMRKESAGGGVVIDTGSHLLGQTLSVFGNPVGTQVLSYQDDSFGGVEADAQMRLSIPWAGKTVEGTARLSRIANLKNQISVKTACGTFCLGSTQREEVFFTPNNGSPEVRWSATSTQEKSPTIFDAFRREMEDWRDAIRENRQPLLSAESALETVRLIDQCYARQKPRPVSELLDSTEQTFIQSPKSSRKRVLVTGATGFIGGRIVEMFLAAGNYDVRAMVHSAGKASRLARLKLDVVEADLLKPETLKKALEGCDYVIHCAYGTALDRKASLAATTKGTGCLASLARQAGVQLLIHLSTQAVNGTTLKGAITPESPVAPDAYDYARAKAEAEKRLRQEMARGLPTVIFRLGNVFGPFSPPWTLRAAATLKAGLPILFADGSNPSNTLFVDNLVQACACALQTVQTGDTTIIGKTFVLADDRTSWKEFYQPLADALNVRMESLDESTLAAFHRAVRSSITGNIRALLADCKDILVGEELKRFAIRLLTSKIGQPLYWTFYNVPGVRPCLRRILGLNRPDLFYPTASESISPAELIRRQPENYAAELVNLFDIYACRAAADDSQTRKLLNYTPLYSPEQAIEKTLAWCRDSGVIS